jgi:hypothetical protein
MPFGISPKPKPRRNAPVTSPKVFEQAMAKPRIPPLLQNNDHSEMGKKKKEEEEEETKKRKETKTTSSWKQENLALIVVRKEKTEIRHSSCIKSVEVLKFYHLN